MIILSMIVNFIKTSEI